MKKVDKHLDVIPLKQIKNRAIYEQNLVPSLSEIKRKNGLLHQFVDEMMSVGQDYGLIKGYQKPTLLKPGAEKLCQFFQLSVEYSVVKRLEDWERGLFHYEVKAQLHETIATGKIVDGIGSCNSKEHRFQKQHPFSIVNTVLKMAKKRALIDGVLNITVFRELF